MASSVLLLVLIATTLLGQFYVIVAGFNRFNAMGWNRKLIKASEKLHILIGVCLPIVFLLWEYSSLRQSNVPIKSLRLTDLQIATQVYLVVMSVIAVIFTPLWISIRPLFVIATDRFREDSKVVWDADSLTRSPYANRTTQFLGKIPRNEIGYTEANHKTLILAQLPRQLQGLRIGHLSDIHLTGQLSYEFYHRAFDWIMEQNPDLVVLSGDIVDYDENLADLYPTLNRLTAPLGCYFVLGNHDRRLTNPLQICDQLTAMGWHDAGAKNHVIRHESIPIEIRGNEKPWFDRDHGCIENENPDAWRLGIAHSPDQFSWGIKNGCSLLLCGHTHGGQIRIPCLGPLISPSMHGSKYASGVFYRSGTLMHVSRGMAGVHPLRWRCPPEVSILHLSSE